MAFGKISVYRRLTNKVQVIYFERSGFLAIKKMAIKEKKIELPGIGKIKIRRNTRAKNLIIKIKPFSDVVLVIPGRTSITGAMKFLSDKAEWILKSKYSKEKIENRIIEKAIEKNMLGKNVDRNFLRNRVKLLAEKYGFKIGKVTIRDQKTRWGSCSAKNNININWRTGLLEAELRDYVILHELVHTRVKNHGPGFWKELDRFFKSSRQVDKRLDEYNFLIYLSDNDLAEKKTKAPKSKRLFNS